MSIRRHLLTIVIISSILTFSVLYYLLDVFTDEVHFNGLDGRTSYFDKLYLSVITQATIGFGDVTPASRIAKLLVMTQALVTVFSALYITAYTDTHLAHVIDQSFDDSLKQVTGKSIRSFEVAKLLN